MYSASWALLLVAAASGAGMLWHKLHRKKAVTVAAAAKDNKGIVPKARKKQLARHSPGNTGVIPDHELAALQAFLRRVCRWRGWQGGAYHIMQAWHDAEVTATADAGGAWQPHFSMLHLNDANCDALLGIIDMHFFGGKLLKKMVKQVASNGVSAKHMGAGHTTAQQRIGCRAVQALSSSWLAYFDVEDNVIYINYWRWDKQVSAEQPLNCEGVVCISRLQVLLHTLAHELVHAVVFHIFPYIDKASLAYLPNGRHGPVFQLLNKQLFGHTSEALHDVQLLPCS